MEKAVNRRLMNGCGVVLADQLAVSRPEGSETFNGFSGFFVYMRIQFNGKTSDSHSENAGSIPVIRSTVIFTDIESNDKERFYEE